MAVNGAKRRKVSHEAEENDAVASKDAQKAFFKHASSWDLEQDYESRPRKGKKDKKDSSRLPTRTADGHFEKGDVDEEEEEISVASDEDWLEGEEDLAPEPEEDEPKEKEPEKPVSQQIREAQEELAKIATSVSENPEEHAGAFKALAKIGQSSIPNIQMLALVTQMTVYKDVIPGYRIRPVAEDASKEKLSKEIRQLRGYEQALVSGYSNYIKELARCARIAGKPVRGQTLSNVAIKCACTLVTSVPHFNFLIDLLKILVNKLSRRKIDKDGIQCLKTLETLFKDDEESKPSLEAVSILSKMMKAREYQVHEQVLNLFLSLRLLSEFSGKASRDGVDKPEESNTVKRKSFKKEFRTKKERKNIKEQKALEKDMAHADALVNHEERERMQSETLKMVFASYFRVLKLRTPHLMGAVLEGLAKYAHLINQDFFGDLLEALKDIIRHSDEDQDETSEDAVTLSEQAPIEGQDSDDEDMDGNAIDDIPTRNLTREALLCTVTAFALLAGQDAHNSRNTLHLDLAFFTTHLYRSLLTLSTVPDIENTAASNSSALFRINVHTTTVLLLRSLKAILIPSYNSRSVPPLRLASFSKQLMTTALQVPEKSCQAILVLLEDVAHTHGKKISAMWNTEERKGDGKFNALSTSVEGSNPFAATIWEGELLRKHFSPKVREGVKLLEKNLSASK